jgi:pyrimidine operon attenuation protein/uracil phosphoribosyltransferase
MTAADKLDAEALYADLVVGVRGLLKPGGLLVGIWSGGAWLAERLQKDCGLVGAPGVISSALHRDDFSQRGLSAGADHTKLPFEIEGRHIVLVDDVLYTGRTIRAAMDVLADYGRPRAVQLAALVDRGRRELPIQPDYVGIQIQTTASESVRVMLKERGETDRVVLRERRA